MKISQVGLSWKTILTKEQSFRKAYDNFNIRKVTAYTEADRERFLTDAGIIHNRLKVDAAIENAKATLLYKMSSVRLKNGWNTNTRKTKDDWVNTVQKNISFYRWRNRKRVSNEYWLFARGTYRKLSCSQRNP